MKAARECRDSSRIRIERLDLVVVGVGDVNDAVMNSDTKRMLQPDRIAGPVLIAELEQVATGNRRHRVDRRQRNGTNRVRLGIGDKQRVVSNSKTRGLREGGGIDLTVPARLLSGAGIRI